VDVVLSVPLGVGVALVAVVALVLLRRTRLFWLPGAALMGYGGAIYVTWPWHDTHDDVTMLGGVANLMHVAASFIVVAGGIVCVIVGARSWRRARTARTALTAIPTAIVTKDMR
jgi:hypothetical protein